MDYVAQPGDSLYRIALKSGLSIPEIRKTNALSGEGLQAGQPLFLPVLPQGVTGGECRQEGVARIQEVLCHLGYAVAIDGVYGSETAQVIRSIQKKLPEIEDDGVYGAKTRAFLKRLLYADCRVVKNPSSLLALVNKKNALPPTFVPGDLVIPEIPFAFEGFDPKRQIRLEAAGALEKLLARARGEGILLYGVSGYRSYERQAELFKRNWLKSPADANRTSARPGESEHQTGLAIDVSCPVIRYELEEVFGEMPEGRWLEDNAPHFGFIIRYPRGKESVTGYAYEPWHIRYVGRSAARAVAENALALEEYFAP